MLLLPAVDIKNGRCVRLDQGDPDRETVFEEDPLAPALGFQKQGAKMLHVVDLDGAFEGSPNNMALIKRMAGQLNIPIEVGGGIRSIEVIAEYLDAGVKRVIIGTSAIKDPAMLKESIKDFGSEHIVVGVDARDGFVAVDGWKTITDRPVADLLSELEGYGVKTVIYTDISRDGMMKGPNVESTREVAESTSIEIVASGGISSLADLSAIKELEPSGVVAVITGKAVYQGAFTVVEALEALA